MASSNAKSAQPIDSKKQAEAVEPKHFGPLHKPFSWLHKDTFDHRAGFLARTFDVCRGVEICLEIVMGEQLRSQSGADDTDPEDRSLIGAERTERLLLLALAATRMLADEADMSIDALNRVDRQESKQ